MVIDARGRSDQSFPAIMRFGIVPMFLFAGAFYPIDQLPDWLQLVARATPLYHGVELCRGAVLGTLGVADAVVHVAVLVAFWLAGFLICRRTFARRLRDMTAATHCIGRRAGCGSSRPSCSPPAGRTG